MFAVLLSHPLLAWFADGHVVITMTAVGWAVSKLDTMGVLSPMGTGTTRLKMHLSMLWAMNVCQDFDEGNLLGMCGIELPGGQIAHFMADSGQPKAEAYQAAVHRIREESVNAWSWYRKGFPEKKPEQHHGGLLGVLEAVAEYNPVTLAYKGAKEVVEEVEIQDANRHLSRALHALDSFSPSHTVRDVGTLAIKEIFDWGPYNKGEHDDDRFYGGHWPGHKAMDLYRRNDLTHYLAHKAAAASCDLIVAVLGNLYDVGYFSGALNNVVGTHMEKGW